MSFGDDEDILQDFLVEAGEILDRLGQQLVDLEQRPEDKALLNEIFRGFHTVKGGAGFLSLTPMVECCHLTENLFDILRNGKRSVTPELMDVVLQSLDNVNRQFELVSQHQPLPPVEHSLIAALERLVSCADLEENGSVAESVDHAVPDQQEESVSVGQKANQDNSQGQDITDEEFESLLDAVIEKESEKDQLRKSSDFSSNTGSEDITDDEFEALLDEFHGSGKGPSSTKTPAIKPPIPSVAVTSQSPHTSDEITQDEFEALLDQLHGKGKAPAGSGNVKAPVASVPISNKQSSTSKEITGGDTISDEEFDSLIDQLNTKGKGAAKSKAIENKSAPVVKSPAVPVAPVKKPEVKPLEVKTTEDKATAQAKIVAAPTKTTAATPAVAASNANAEAAVETTVRVDTQRLDDIMNMVGELVLVRNRLVRLGNGSTDESLVKAVANLDVVTADLQTSVMKTRMQPIKKVFGRFPRVVRDLARSLRKEINLELVGEETDLDKNLVEALADPLVHLVRNSVDHGVEYPEVREAAGKSRTGLVILSAEQEGDHILLSISDDGAGMDPVKLRSIAVEKGLFDEDAANRLSDVEAYNLIFAPGFSTKKEISDVSGRGVGMDVVKTKISQLNGTVEIKSELGKGTRFIIKVPLTLAIMPTLMYMLGKQTFAFPLVSVNEIFHMDLSKTHVVDGQDCIAIRDQAIPLFYLKEWLVKNAFGDRPSLAHVVIVTVGTRRVGFVVDQLIGQEEVVIKPLGKMLQGTPGIAGATITGDGTIALIIDVPSLLRRYAKNAA
jgi:two-component system, chemotaxis family, sensor kinase CheA